MVVFEQVSDVRDHVGRELGVSDWMAVPQELIDRFAAVTGDDQWIHVDPVRAAAEAVGGTTIAHGYLTLSLIPVLQRQVHAFANRSRGINYGLDRIRFTAAVPAGARIRLRQTLAAATLQKDGGWRIVLPSTIEIESCERPALVADAISVAYP